MADEVFLFCLFAFFFFLFMSSNNKSPVLSQDQNLNDKNNKSNQLKNDENDTKQNEQQNVNNYIDSQLDKNSQKNLQEFDEKLFISELTSSFTSFKRKLLFLKIANLEYKIPDQQESTKSDDETYDEDNLDENNEFFKDYFIDKYFVAEGKPMKKPKDLMINIQTLIDNSNMSKWKTASHSYSKVPKPIGYSRKYPFLIDFICNWQYLAHAVGSEGQKLRGNLADDQSPYPVDDALLKLSAIIDETVKGKIKYDLLINKFLDINERSVLLKKIKLSDQEQFLKWMASKKMKLEDNLKNIEDDRKFIFKEPILFTPDQFDTYPYKSFPIEELQFLYYILVLVESKTMLSRRHERPITTCLSKTIPLLLKICHPSIINYPVHLAVSMLHVNYFRILFDTLNALSQYLSDIGFIPFRASFGMCSFIRSDLTLDSIPPELKRLFDSIDRGGSMTSKLYELRNISLQMIVRVNGIRLLTRILQLLDNKEFTEQTLLSGVKNDLISQKIYLVHFILQNDHNICFEVSLADKNLIPKLNKYELNIFPNYTCIHLQPKNDPTIIKYEGIMEGNLAFFIKGSQTENDDQLHLSFVNGSYGIICNFTDPL